MPENGFISIEEFAAGIQHRYLPDEHFARVSRSAAVGTLISMDAAIAQPVLCEILAIVVPKLDKIIQDQKVKRPLYVVFTGGASTIAQAVKAGELYAICLDYELIDICLKLATITYFSDAYINKTVFTLKERNRDPRWLVTRGRYFKNIREVDVEGCFFDDEDFMHITAISNFVISGVLSHEITHVVNGHLAYLDKMKTDSPSYKLDALTLQTMEFDADASFILSYLYEVDELGSFSLSPDNPREFVFSTNATAAIFYGILAFKLLELLDSGRFDRSSSSHLPSGVRSRHAFATIMTLLLKCAEESNTTPDLKFIGKQIIEIIHMVEGIFYIASDKASSPFRLIDKDSEEEYASITNAVRRRWVTLQPQLNECKIGSGKLAPALFDDEIQTGE